MPNKQKPGKANETSALVRKGKEDELREKYGAHKNGAAGAAKPKREKRTKEERLQKVAMARGESLKSTTESLAPKKQGPGKTISCKKLIRAIKQNEILFSGFGALKNTNSVGIYIEDEEEIDDAVYKNALRPPIPFEPIKFRVKDGRTKAQIFQANVEFGDGFNVYSTTAVDCEKVLMSYKIPEDTRPIDRSGVGTSASAIERKIGHLYLPSKEAVLYNLALVMKPGMEQFNIQSLGKAKNSNETKNMQVLEDDGLAFIFRTLCCTRLLSRQFKVVKDGKIMGKIRPGREGHHKALTLTFTPDANEENRAAILGFALYLTLEAYPRCMTILESSVNYLETAPHARSSGRH